MGTDNALVFDVSAMDSNVRNIVEYKQKTVLGLAGSQIEEVCEEPLMQTHEMTKIDKPYRCAYCAMCSIFDNANEANY